MIVGRVTEQREALVTLTLHDGRGNIYDVEALVDTGFNGDITLPTSVIEKMQLRWLFRQRGMLADGAIGHI